MNINSKDCNKESYNILGYFGGIPEGRTYSKKPRDYCPSNPINFFVGKCKKKPLFNYDICYTSGNGDNDITIYYDKNKCVTINEIKFKYYNYFNGINLCSNNDNKLNYYTLLKNSTSTIDDCLKQKNMKVCGILDDLNQIVCLHQNYSCPINDIIFNQNQTYSIKINETIINYDNIKINDNLYIHYTNKNINKKIISSFNISFNKPCSHMYQNPKRSNIFIAYDFIHCNECNNTLFEYIYYENATKFMKDNSLYSLFQQFNPELFNDYNVNLFSSFYFGLNKTCILEHNFDNNSFSNYFSKYSSFRGFFITFTIFYISFVLLMGVNSPSMNQNICLFIILHVSFFIICTILLIISHILFTEIYSPLDCRDANINDIIQSYKKFRRNKRISFTIIKILFIFYFCMILFELYLVINPYIKDYINKIEIEKKKQFEKKEYIKNMLLNKQNEPELQVNLIE